MSNKLQHQIFLKEGDRWFLRNKSKLKKVKRDLITDYLQGLDKRNLKILEVGCGNGWRLSILKKKLKADCYGIEISKVAVAAGKNAFPLVNIKQGFSHRLIFKDNFFDVVIFSFVFHWVDRNKLLQTVAEADRVLKNKGLLIIQDFDPGIRCKIAYHHLPRENLFTFKQKYWDIFVASGLYSVINDQEFEHSPGEFGLNNLCRFIVLQKRGSDNYTILGK